MQLTDNLCNQQNNQSEPNESNAQNEMPVLFADYPDIVTVDQLKEMLDIGIVLAYSLVKSG